MSLALQYVLLAVIGLACVFFVLRSQMPGTWRTVTGKLALWAVREGHPGWLQRLGRRIAPAARASHGCGGCDNDDACH